MALNESIRSELVKSILLLFDKQEILDTHFRRQECYQKLNHPNLANQLLPYIIDSSKNIVVRRVAVDIAEACELREVQYDILKLALDQNESPPVRVNAAYCIKRIGDNDTVAKLKPLTNLFPSDDSLSELKGVALNALFPDHISAQEMFFALTPPLDYHFVGSYHMFLSHHLPKNLRVDDLPHAIEWFATHVGNYNFNHFFDKLVSEIIDKTIDNLHCDHVLDCFCAHIKDIIGSIRFNVLHQKLNKISHKDQTRIRLISKLILTLDYKQDEHSLHEFRVFISPEDLDLLIALYEQREFEDKKDILLTFIEYAVDFQSIQSLVKIKEFCNIHHIKKESLQEYYFVKIFTTRSKQLRDSYEKMLNFERQNEINQNKPPRMHRDIPDILSDIENGEPFRWHELRLALYNNQDDGNLEWTDDIDITDSAIWNLLDDDEQKRVVFCAKAYLLAFINDKRYYLKHVNCPFDYLAYHALILIYIRDNSFLNQAKPEFWQEWIPTILCYRSPYNDERFINIQRELIKIAFPFTKQRIIETIKMFVENNTYGIDLVFDHNLLSSIGKNQQNEIYDITVELILKLERISNVHQIILAWLVRNKHALTILRLSDIIERPINKCDTKSSHYLIESAKALMAADDASWKKVWSFLNRYPLIGKRLFLVASMIHRIEEVRFAHSLSESELAQFYIWLREVYPQNEEFRVQRGTTRTSPIQYVIDFRESILNSLVNRGTSESIHQIKQLMIEYPDDENLKYKLVISKDAYRQAHWSPMSPSQLSHFVQETNARIITNTNQLQKILVSTMKMFEEEHQGPKASRLWNTRGRKTPKYERELTQEIENYFKERLANYAIAVNREVEILRIGQDRSKSVDILVECFETENKDRVQSFKIICEVKCCWSDSIFEKMKTQLLSDYLVTNSTKHGIYIVFWFQCAQCELKCRKKVRAEQIGNTETAMNILSQQAKYFEKQGFFIQPVVINAIMPPSE